MDVVKGRNERGKTKPNRSVIPGLDGLEELETDPVIQAGASDNPKVP